MAHIVSVNVGLPQAREWAGIGRTSIDKRPVGGRVAVGLLGLEGDQVSDTRHHGGIDQAVYAYSREDLAVLEAELGLPVRDGQFGENLTTSGIDLTHVEVGTRLQVGADGVVLEVASVRIPCNDFKGWMGETGYDPRGWVKRFAAAARPGPYFRVLEPGTIGAGDPIHVLHAPGHGVTVRHMFLALTSDRSLLPRLLEVDGLVEQARLKAEDYVSGAGTLLPGVPQVT